MKSAPDGSRAILCRVAAPLILSLTVAAAQAQSCAPGASDPYVLATPSDEVRQVFLFHSGGPACQPPPAAASLPAESEGLLAGLEACAWLRTESRAGAAPAGRVVRADNWNFAPFASGSPEPAAVPAGGGVDVQEFAWTETRTREVANAIPEPSALFLMLPGAMLLIRRRRK